MENKLTKIKLVFIHHSTGANLIRQGKIREILSDNNPDIEFWDHSYNLLPFWQITAKIIPFRTGLCDQNGNLTGTDYNIQIANTDPQGYADLFSQEIHIPADNSFGEIINNFDIIMFKSCFPVTEIKTQEQLDHYKKCYLIIREKIDKLPEKLFILFTPPPLRSEMTKKDYAYRAREFSDWMKSEEYLGRRKNMAVFDFFDILADQDNVLARNFCSFLFFDSHPNKLANVTAGKELVKFISENASKFFQ